MTRTIVITGASSGIGEAAARQLHANGCDVVVVGRSPGKTAQVAKALGARYFISDFSRLDDVRRLAAQLDQACPRIDVLANNAGGIFGEREKTVDGFESTLQINHLAPFLLTRLLMPKLLASGASVIQTSSVAARLAGKLNVDDLNLDKRYSALRAYCAAKLANILFTHELHERYNQAGLSAAAFHPGSIASNFALDSHSFLRFMAKNRLFRVFMKTPAQGADQLVWLARTNPGIDWVSGKYYEKRRPARTSPQALDADLSRRLWQCSEQLLGLDQPVAEATSV